MANDPEQAPGEGRAVPPEKKPSALNPLRWLKRLYDWVVGWADTPFGSPALAVIAFTESIFFPIPPDALQIALSLGKPKRSYRYALYASIGSIFGGIAAYALGALVPESFIESVFTWMHQIEAYEKAKDIFHERNFLIVFTVGFTPLPFKVITVAAGVTRANFLVFLAATATSRAARFYLVATLFYFWGEKAKTFIEKYFNLLSVLFAAAIVLGFFALKYLF